MLPTSGFHTGARDSDSAPHACTVSNLSTEPSSQPHLCQGQPRSMDDLGPRTVSSNPTGRPWLQTLGSYGLGLREKKDSGEAPCNLLGSVRLALATFKHRFSKNGIFFHYQGNTCSLFSNSNNREIYNTERGRESLSSHLPLPEITVGNSVTEIFFLTFLGVCKYRRLYLLKDRIRLF